jgi:hypothetical protein
MTAREQIEMALATLWGFTSLDELGADRPRRLLDQYAHELAEHIRHHDDCPGIAEHCCMWAADLIDPEVTR